MAKRLAPVLRRISHAESSILRTRQLLTHAQATVQRQRLVIASLESRIKTLENPGTRGLIAHRTRLLAAVENLETELLSILEQAESRG